MAKKKKPDSQKLQERPQERLQEVVSEATKEPVTSSVEANLQMLKNHEDDSRHLIDDTMQFFTGRAPEKFRKKPAEDNTDEYAAWLLWREQQGLDHIDKNAKPAKK